MQIYKPDGTLITDILVDDNSFHYKELMGDDDITLFFSNYAYLDIPLYSYIIYNGFRFTLEDENSIKIRNLRNFEYQLTFRGTYAILKRHYVRNIVFNADYTNFTGNLDPSFLLTEQPQNHLKMICDTLNLMDSTHPWVIGSDCITGDEKLIEYDYITCYEALVKIADAFDTEFDISDKTIFLKQISSNSTTNDALPLQYGKNNGILPEYKRETNVESNIGVLFCKGTERNIDRSTYGNKTLLLPESGVLGYDGFYFSNEIGYDSTKGIDYQVCNLRNAICRSDWSYLGNLRTEDSLDCTEIYPSRVGTVTSVVQTTENGKVYYDFIDNTIPPNLDYSQCRIAGETMYVTFQSGMLAGKSFDIESSESSLTGYDHSTRKFKLVKNEYDNIMMPNSTYLMAVGDSYAVFGCALPSEYLSDNSTKTGASWDMFRYAIKSLFERQSIKYKINFSLDGIFAFKNWSNIGNKLVIGSHILFSDVNFMPTPVLMKINSIKTYINKPKQPEIEMSNAYFTPYVRLRDRLENYLEAKNNSVLNKIAATKLDIRRVLNNKETIEKYPLSNLVSQRIPAYVLPYSRLEFDTTQTAYLRTKSLNIVNASQNVADLTYLETLISDVDIQCSTMWDYSTAMIEELNQALDPSLTNLERMSRFSSISGFKKKIDFIRDTISTFEYDGVLVFHYSTGYSFDLRFVDSELNQKIVEISSPDLTIEVYSHVSTLDEIRETIFNTGGVLDETTEQYYYEAISYCQNMQSVLSENRGKHNSYVIEYIANLKTFYTNLTSLTPSNQSYEADLANIYESTLVDINNRICELQNQLDYPFDSNDEIIAIKALIKAAKDSYNFIHDLKTCGAIFNISNS